jgi:uncharacterized membrane protein YeaQ/YmgE (transglycosylase-associated protein family)
MLDQLFNLVKQFGGDSVVNNPDVPNEQNNAVMAEATGTIAGGFQNLLSGGGLQSILSLFKGGGSTSGGKSGLMSNPIVSMMVGHFASKLMGKFGIKSGIAGNIAGSLIPNVLSGLISKTNDSNDSSFSLDGIIRSLTGGGGAPAQNNAAASGGGFDLNGILGKLTGGDRDGDGDTDLQDALAAITGGARQQQQQQAQSGGGLMDMIKGLIG